MATAIIKDVCLQKQHIKKKQNPSGLPFMALLRSQRPPRAHNVWNCHKKQKTQSFFLPLEYQSLLDHSNTPKWNESCGTYHPSLAAWDCWHMQGKKKNENRNKQLAKWPLPSHCQSQFKIVMSVGRRILFEKPGISTENLWNFKLLEGSLITFLFP